MTNKEAVFLSISCVVLAVLGFKIGEKYGEKIEKQNTKKQILKIHGCNQAGVKNQYYKSEN